MKNILVILFVVLVNSCFGQSRKDTVVFDKINVTYLNSIVLEICNERIKDSGVVHKYNEVNFKCAEYQSSYMANYSICTHKNNKSYRGVFLTEPIDRRNYFDKSGVLNIGAEICTVKTLQTKMTYEDLANGILNNFFKSEPHRKTIMIDYPYLSFSCTVGSYNGYNAVFVAGYLSR